MSAFPGERHATPSRRRPRLVVSALGVTQILAWGSTYYLLAVLARPIALDTGWPLPGVIGGLSAGLLTSGLAAPLTGRLIDERGGRPVLMASSMLIAAGLVIAALAPGFAFYVGGWIVIGLGMSAGLYDAGFSTLGRLYGGEARRSIAVLTLYGGLASTLCWPLTAMFLDTFGWRGACLAYAALHLGLALPVHAFLVPALPRIDKAETATETESAAHTDDATPARSLLLVVLLGVTIATGAGIAAVVSVHLLTLLQAGGMSLAAAVALGALIGPSQVGARIVEMALGHRYHPIFTLVASTVLTALGLLLLLIGPPVLATAMLIYGAGMGIKSIARGTVPLALFGPRGYSALMGRLAMPSLIVEALLPVLVAAAIASRGASAVELLLVAAGLANVLLAGALWAAWRVGRR